LTISTSRTNELTLGQIVKTAYVQAGLSPIEQSINQARSAHALLLLDTIMKGVQDEGIYARSVAFQTITLTVGTYVYTMDPDVLDVVGIGMWISADQAGSPTAANELPVKDVLRDTWQTQTSKDAEGRPIQYYCHRAEAIPQVWIWPKPSASEDGSLIRFQVHRLKADTSDANATADAERYWQQFLIYELAHQLSLGAQKALDRTQYLSSIAQNQKRLAKMYSMQRTETQLVLGTNSGRRRR
jgi:hypothetical protein